MNSSEEYLDNLLKALLESENKTDPKPDKEESPEAMFASIGDISENNNAEKAEEQAEDDLEQSAPTVSNKAMSTDEIEEMFATMSDGIVTGSSALTKDPMNSLPEESYAGEVPESADPVLEEIAQPDEILTDESPETAAFDEWALEEEAFPEEEPLAEEAALDEWALEEEAFPEIGRAHV